MARSYLVFGDIEGKLDVLRVECTKCDRKGICLSTVLCVIYLSRRMPRRS